MLPQMNNTSPKPSLIDVNNIGLSVYNQVKKNKVYYTNPTTGSSPHNSY